jgi:hypothetical protein
MKLFSYGKDGGAESTVWGLWLIELKSLFSVALLVFEGKSREVYHTHAFNSISWLLKGGLTESRLLFRGFESVHFHRPSWYPIITTKDNLHKVDSSGTSWVLTFRGPWAKTWTEFDPTIPKFTTLADGRRKI